MNYLIYLPTIFIWTFPRGSSAQLTKGPKLNAQFYPVVGLVVGVC